jgi:signal transduction histidine kinase
MKFIDWRSVKELSRLLTATRPEAVQQAKRSVAMQLHIVLPIKAGVIGIMFYYLLYPGWLQGLGVTTIREVVLEMLQWYSLVYALCNAVAAVLFILWRRFPPGIFQWLVFTLGLLDGLFVAGLIFNAGGFESTAYWLFPGLIVLNAFSIPLATPQIVLNLSLSVFYAVAGVLDAKFPAAELRTAPVALHQAGGIRMTARFGNTNPPAPVPGSNQVPRSRKTAWSRATDLPYDTENRDTGTGPYLPRLAVLWLLTACCYGVQVLAERQQQALEEAREFEVRERQLRSAGQLAAEFAHQIKNPLAIINNAVFSLQRALNEGRNDAARQIGIIREEVERSDRIVTQIMGYAQLSEGRLEKLTVTEELDSAIGQVFPPGAGYPIRVERHYEQPLPPLLMQRRHFSEILANLLQNAREALIGGGDVSVTARCRADFSIEIVIADTGPGIPPDKLERIFEAYYTTKEKGTGLGLAIVKHNIDLYGGTVRVESTLGQGTRFILLLPSKAVVRLERPA